jgi:alpha-galactosidase
LKAPLLIGCSLDNITQTTLALLGNEELIAINQDGLGVQASRLKREVYQDGVTEVWGGPLTNLAYVLVFFNRGDKTKNISISLSSEAHIKFRTYSLRDVVNHKQLGLKTDDIL